MSRASIIKFLVPLSLGLLFLAGCLTKPKNAKKDVQLIAADSVTAVEVQGRNVTFTIWGDLPNSCWNLSGANHFVNNTEILLQLYALQSSSSACSAEIKPEKIDIGYTVSQGGTYHFHFWRSDNVSLDKTVTFR